MFLVMFVAFFYICNLDSQISWTPANSTITNVGSSSNIIPPIGWNYIGTTLQNGVMNFAIAVAKISCDCNDNSGDCLPFESSSGMRGCAGTCKNCTMTQSIASGPNYTEFTVTHGGYYSLNLTPRVIQNEEIMPGVFEELFGLPQFRNELENFLKNAFGSKPYTEATIGSDGILKAPLGYKLIRIAIFGRAGIVVVPKEYFIKGGDDGGGGYSCFCTSGNCVLKKKSYGPFGSIYYCEGDCSGKCTLSTPSIIGGIINYSY
jgi:hypothetical protein